MKKVIRCLLVVGSLAIAALLCQMNTRIALAEEKGLVGYWSFDEGIGGTAKDSSVNKNHGKIHGAAEWVEGIEGKALKFDGIDDYVDCGNKSSLNITDAITIEAWIYPVAYDFDVGGGIVSKTYHTESVYSIRLPRGRLMFRAFTGYQGENTTTDVPPFTRPVKWITCTTPATDVIPLNQWTYVAAAYDRSRLKLYINGEVKATFNKSAALMVHGESLLIGSVHKDGRRFNGAIDEVRIYNRALTAQEIKDCYIGKLSRAGVKDKLINILKGEIAANLKSASDYKEECLNLKKRGDTLSLQNEIDSFLENYKEIEDGLHTVKEQEKAKLLLEKSRNLLKEVEELKGKVLLQTLI